jgi:soluble lytic murein transglycosylase-like protein
MQARRILLALILLTANPAFAGSEQEVDARLVRALREAVEYPTWFSDEIDGLMWLAHYSGRLKKWLPDPFYRVNLLREVHYEAGRARLDPALVLAVIDVESDFDRFAVSRSGARGLMQIMPFWKKEIGHPRDNLFHPVTNLRYGCTILRHYLRLADGDIGDALARYNGSEQRYAYSRKVQAAWRRTWGTSTLTANR